MDKNAGRLESRDAEAVLSEAVLDRIEEAILDIGFGSVTLTVQDGKVIQMDKLDKIRLG